MKYYNEQRIKRILYIFSTLTFILYGILFIFMGNSHAPHIHGPSILSWLVTQWKQPDNWYGWLIIPICVYLIWKRKDRFKVVRKLSNIYAIILILLCLFLYWAGYRAQQPRLGVIAIISLLWSILLFLYGWNFAKIALFPSAYLFFAIPTGTLSSITIHLRILVSQAATFLLNGFGIGAIRHGTMIISESGRFLLYVEEPCSGLHSFFALAPLISAYADISEKTLWKKWLIFLSTVPVAILANIVRIMVVAVAGEWFGSHTATSFYHTWSGYIVFIVAVLCVTGLSSLLKTYFPDNTNGVTHVPCIGENVAFNKPQLHLLQHICLSLLFIVTIAEIHLTGEPIVSDVLPIKSELPDKIGKWHGYKVMWCQNEKCRKQLVLEANEQLNRCTVCESIIYDMSIAEKKTLTSDARLSRRFYSLNKDEHGFMVSTVIAGKDRSSLHPPQWCLPGQGYKILDEQVMEIESVNTSYSVMLMTLQPSGETHQNGFYNSVLYAYWFESYKKQTANHLIRLLWTAWDSIVRGKIDRWAYISVVYASPDNREIAKKTLIEFIALLHKEIIVR